MIPPSAHEQPKPKREAPARSDGLGQVGRGPPNGGKGSAPVKPSPARARQKPKLERSDRGQHQGRAQRGRRTATKVPSLSVVPRAYTASVVPLSGT